MQLLCIATLLKIYCYFLNYVCVVCGGGAWCLRVQMPAGLDSRELELKEIVSQFMWVLGTELLSYARAVHALSS